MKTQQFDSTYLYTQASGLPISRWEETSSCLLMGPIKAASADRHWKSLRLRLPAKVEKNRFVVLTACVEHTEEGTGRRASGSFPGEISDLQDSLDQLWSRMEAKDGLSEAQVNCGRRLTQVWDRLAKPPGAPIYWHVYPWNSPEMRLWHMPGDRRRKGTDLWVALLVRVGPDEFAAVLDEEALEIEIEDFEYGWERDIPSLFRRPTNAIPHTEDVEPVDSASITMDALLSVFERCGTQRMDEIEAIKDWFALADDRNQDVAGDSAAVDARQLLDYMGGYRSIDEFAARGSLRAFKESVEKTIRRATRNPHANFELVEPLLDARVRMLGSYEDIKANEQKIRAEGYSPATLLNESSVLTSGTRCTDSGIELTGLEHLLGRARLQLQHADIPEEQREELEAEIKQLAPANVMLTFEYLGGPARLNRNARLGECLIG